MASEEILITYRAELEGFKAQLTGLEGKMRTTESAGKKVGETTGKSLDDAGKKAGPLGDQFKKIGAYIVAAFAVERIIAFGNQSVKAFREAEVNAKKLESAVKLIGKEGDAAFQKLISQSQKLQSISIFDDDSIQKAQTQLIQFGLTSDEVEKLIPKIVDLASATGGDLGSATDTVIQGVSGLTRGLKPLGIEFKATGSKAENLAILTEKLGKFQGQTAVALETSAGKAKQLENAYGDLQENIGSLVTNILDGIVPALAKMTGLINDSFKSIEEINAEVALNATQRAAEDAAKEFVAYAKAMGIAKDDKEGLVKASDKFISVRKQELVQLDKEFSKSSMTADARNKRADSINAEITGVKNYIAALLNQGKATENEITTVQKLKDQIAEKEKAILEANIADGSSIKLSREKFALEERLKVALGEETEAQKKASEAAKTAAEGKAKAVEELAKRLDAVRKIEVEQGIADADSIALAFSNSIAAVQNEINAVDNAKLLFAKLSGDKTEIAKAELDKQIVDINNNYDAQVAAQQELGGDISRVNDERNLAIELAQKEHQAKLTGIQKEEAEKRKVIDDQAFNESIEFAQKGAQIFASINDAALGYELSSLQAQLNNKQISQEQYDQKVKAAKKTAAQNDKALSVFTATINTFRAIAEALPNVPLSILAGVLGGAQIAAILAQPIPEFATGTEYLKRGRNRPGRDTIPIMANEGEAIIPTDKNAKYPGLAAAMIAGDVDRYVLRNFGTKFIAEKMEEIKRGKDKSFTENLMQSFAVNNKGFYDGNLLESDKRNRELLREQNEILRSIALKQSASNPRKF